LYWVSTPLDLTGGAHPTTAEWGELRATLTDAGDSGTANNASIIVYKVYDINNIMYRVLSFSSLFLSLV
jgi:hypothetical protein